MCIFRTLSDMLKERCLTKYNKRYFLTGTYLSGLSNGLCSDTSVAVTDSHRN
jgi:hypothetical protein